jgi:hypothetical protein
VEVPEYNAVDLTEPTDERASKAGQDRSTADDAGRDGHGFGAASAQSVADPDAGARDLHDDRGWQLQSSGPIVIALYGNDRRTSTQLVEHPNRRNVPRMQDEVHARKRGDDPRRELRKGITNMGV